MSNTYYYYRASQYGHHSIQIIDQATMDEAEAGNNYINPDDFLGLGEYESLDDAFCDYWREISAMPDGDGCDVMLLH